MELHEFVAKNREALIVDCLGKAAKRTDLPPEAFTTDHGVPMFLDQLVEELRAGLSDDAALVRETASQHGRDLLVQGYSISQVVHGYGDICQAITQMALAQDVPIGTDDFRMLNRLLDEAIASAVTQFSEMRDQQSDGKASGEKRGVADRLHELGRLISASAMALDAIKSGRVGMAGSTGTLLQSAIRHSSDLISQLLEELHVRRSEPADDTSAADANSRR